MAFDAFYAQLHAFLQLLGEPVDIEDFDIPNIVFFILADGTEGELGFGCESQFDSGPYHVLLDKKGILTDMVFPDPEPDPGEQREKLRRLIY